MLSVWKLNGEYLTPEDEKQDRINECQTQAKFSDPCKKIESLNEIKCGFRSRTLTCSISLLIDLEIFGNEIYNTSFYF